MRLPFAMQHGANSRGTHLPKQAKLQQALASIVVYTDMRGTSTAQEQPPPLAAMLVAPRPAGHTAEGLELESQPSGSRSAWDQSRGPPVAARGPSSAAGDDATPAVAVLSRLPGSPGLPFHTRLSMQAADQRLLKLILLVSGAHAAAAHSARVQQGPILTQAPPPIPPCIVLPRRPCTSPSCNAAGRRCAGGCWPGRRRRSPFLPPTCCGACNRGGAAPTCAGATASPPRCASLPLGWASGPTPCGARSTPRRRRRPPWPPPLPGHWRCTPRGSSLSRGPSPLSWGPLASVPAYFEVKD